MNQSIGFMSCFKRNTVAELMNVPAMFIVPEQAVAQQRQARAEQAQQQQAQQAAIAEMGNM